MQIRNNWGELIGEINNGITDKGERTITNTIYHNGNPVIQNISVRDNQGKVRTTNCDRLQDFAVGRTVHGRAPSGSLLERTGVGPNEMHRRGSQQEHNRREAVWNVNLRPTRQGTRHSDEVVSAEVLKGCEIQQGSLQLVLD